MKRPELEQTAEKEGSASPPKDQQDVVTTAWKRERLQMNLSQAWGTKMSWI